MIGYLKGIINYKQPDRINLLVQDVGYDIYLPPTLLTSLPPSGGSHPPLELFIHTHVREEQLDLYGFKTLEELNLFKIVIGVSGIGTKTGLLIIDRGVRPVLNAIQTADVDFFTGIPRLGKKNAQRIIIELKTKIGSTTELDLSSDSNDLLEVTAALQSMGYSKAELSSVLRKLAPELSVEEKIRVALRELGKP